MGDINKAINLYTLMYERCKENGFCEKQAEIYKEITKFISPCQNAYEAMDKIKNSKYYLAPSVAITKDRLIALKKAAYENNMPEIVEIYNAKLAKIDNDLNEIYDTSYEITINNIKSEYLKTIESFIQLYLSYIRLISTPSNDKIEIEDTYKDIKENINNLSKPSSSFKEVCKNSFFRNLIPCNDTAYKSFVDNISSIINNTTM